MRIVRTTARHTWRWSVRLLIMGVLLAALGLSAMRALTPGLAGYRDAVEEALAEYLLLPVRIADLEAGWEGWRLVLKLEGFSLLDPGGQGPLLGFEQAVLDVDISRSLLAGRPVLRNVMLRGVDLTLEQGGAAGLRLAGPSRDAETVPGRGLVSWLSAIGALDLVSARVRVVAPDRAPLLLEGVGLSLRNVGGRRRLGLEVDDPGELGGHLRAVVEIDAGGTDPSRWQGRFYLNGEELAAAALPVATPPPGGVFSLEAWGEWNGNRLIALQARARARELRPPPHPVHLDLALRLAELASLRVELDWTGAEPAWRLGAVVSGTDRLDRETLRTTVLAEGAPEETDGLVRGSVTGILIADLAAAATPWLPPPGQVLLAGLAPQGRVPELVFRYQPPASGGEMPRLGLRARIQRLETRPWGRVPGLRGLGGVLDVDEHAAHLQLDVSVLTLDAPELLAAPVVLDEVSGSLRWQREATGQRLDFGGVRLGNADLRSVVERGALVLPAGGASPELDLALRARDLDLSRTGAYLPVGLMKPALVSWLRQAVVSGRGRDARVVFRGPVSAFPFDGGEGLFEARVLLEDGILDYREGWPRLEEIEAEVVFRNRAFSFDAVAGKIFDVDLLEARGGWADVRERRLDLAGELRGPGASMLRFLRDSPLSARVGPQVEGMEVSGEGRLTLDLGIPMDGGPASVRGTVDLEGGDLVLGRWGLALEQVSGPLRFTEQGLDGADLSLRFRGRPARLEATAVPAGGTRFLLKGRLGVGELLGPGVARLLPGLSGRADWDIDLLVPRGGAGSGVTMPLVLRSDLRGLTVDLPAPLAKSAGEARPFQAGLSLGGGGPIPVELAYGEALRAVLALADFPAAPRIERGEVRIDAGAASLPEAPGMRLVLRLPRLEVGAGASGGGLPGWARWLQADLGALEVAGQRFAGVAVRGESRGGEWRLDLAGGLAGRLIVPADPGPDAPLRLVLERLDLAPGAGADGDRPPDPRGVPPLVTTVDEFSLEGRPLGALRLVLVPQPDGLRLSEARIESPLHRMEVTGRWWLSGEGQHASLQATLRSQDLGRTLEQLGHPVPVARAAADAEIEGSWAGPLTAFSLARLRGRARLEIGRGRFPRLDPGAGRILGLLSPHTLVRRLRGDFSDVVEEGLAFDRIQGSFRFRAGSAYTDDLALEGPAAEIRLRGRIGLERRDLDGELEVTPRLSSTLPIAGAIAGGPALGAALLLAERVLKDELSQATRYRYRLGGSWDAPELERIVPEPQSGRQSPEMRTR